MEIWWMVLTGLLALCTLVLVQRLTALHRSLREVAEELLGITATNACGGMTFNGEADDENG